MQITATSAVRPVQPIAPAGVQAPTQPPAQHAADEISATTAPAPPVRLLNPQPVIDPALGIVVTEYFNHAGDLTNQYPTEKALDNYRVYGLENGNGGGNATASRIER